MPSYIYIVYQHSGWVLESIQRELSETCFNLGDFVFTDDLSRVREHIEPGKRQLFVTGAEAAAFDTVAQLVRELRQKSPELVVACYSTFALSAPHSSVLPVDRMVHKKDLVYFKDLIAALQEFKEGKLNRIS